MKCTSEMPMCCVAPERQVWTEMTMTNWHSYLEEAGLRLARERLALSMGSFPRHPGCESPDGLLLYAAIQRQHSCVEQRFRCPRSSSREAGFSPV